MYHVLSPVGLIRVRCLGTARELARALGGVVYSYDPRCVFYPPETNEPLALAA